MPNDTQPEPNRPSAHVLVVFGIVAVLRTLPFFVTQWSHIDKFVYLPVGYIPKDWLAYMGMIKEYGRDGVFFGDNPFTTDPQLGRFMLLFHFVLGKFTALTHTDPFWVLELSRIPLLFIFAWVLWRFLTPILPDVRHRGWACWLIALSGGVDFLVRLCADHLPEAIAPRTVSDLWHMFGWNMFESFYNPLWIAALILFLKTLQPLIQPGGPSGWKDYLQSGVGFFLLYFTHPYTGVAIVPILGFYFALRLMFRDGAVWSALLRSGLTLLPAALAIALISSWQNQDDVYKQSASGVFGPQELPVFWYPVAYGALCVFGLLGWRRMIQTAHPWRFALGGWSLAIALLHSCPLINGYKFAFLFYIPLCIAAAPVVSDAFAGLWPSRKPVAVALAGILFASNLELTWRCTDEVRHPYPAGAMVIPDYVAVCKILAAEPSGNVLASANLGNVIPAYANDHVYVGQWFMTPQYGQKSDVYDQVVKYLDVPDRSPATDENVRRLLTQNNIRYFVIPTRVAEKTKAILGEKLIRKLDAGVLCILEVKGPP